LIAVLYASLFVFEGSVPYLIPAVEIELSNPTQSTVAAFHFLQLYKAENTRVATARGKKGFFIIVDFFHKKYFLYNKKMIEHLICLFLHDILLFRFVPKKLLLVVFSCDFFQSKYFYNSINSNQLTSALLYQRKLVVGPHRCVEVGHK
jgi:hypothetical protein